MNGDVLKMEKLLIGRNALITGGAGGIGASTATTFAREGANIVIADIKYDSAVEFCSKLEAEYGVKAKAYDFNARNFASIESFVEQVENEFGPIHILVNNAGISNTVTLEEMTEDAWDLVMDVNLKGPFFLTQKVFERMKERRDGRIVNLASIAGERGAVKSGPHYSISKAGMIVFTKVLAKLGGEYGITANSVSPGVVETDMTKSLGLSIDTYPDIYLKRLGDPTDVANTILFLVSSLGSYLTGQNISVNGGQTMR